MAFQTFSWSFKAAAAVVCGCVCLSARPANRALVGVRPSVAVDVGIMAATYRRTLDHSDDCLQNCRALEALLADTLRVLLEREFAFLDWNSNLRNVSDTIAF